MKNKIVAIHQPNFFPWLGYFVKIAKCSDFVFLDDVQFPMGNRGCNVNRVEVLCDGLPKWLTLSIIKKNSEAAISDIKFTTNAFADVIHKLESWYKKAPHYHETIDFLNQLLDDNFESLAELNMFFVTSVSQKMKFECRFTKSSLLKSRGQKQERIISLVNELGGKHYLSGVGAKKYQEKKDFEANGIELSYLENLLFSYGHFNSQESHSGLSIVDALFNCGFEKTRNMIVKEASHK